MVEKYINQLLLELATGNALEHSYRPALKNLFESIDPSIRAVNEPSRSEHGAPDFAFYKNTNNNLVLGYVETKDLHIDLDQVEKSEQLKRYLGYANLILTNYLEFRFYRNGIKYQSIIIGKPNHSVIAPLPENYNTLERELKAFLEGQPETIRNAKRLAEIMGGKAARIRDNVISYLKSDHERNQELRRIYKVMQELLVHDLTEEKFADMYAQTLVYGLFIARYYDETPESFTRQEARDLVPASNPFLQHFFDHITGSNFDRRLAYIVDELCNVFSVSAVREIVTQHYDLFGEAVDKDPVIHFYEDFLKEYDPQLRKSMGAYYTPVPVVQFIIRSVDDILKSEFGLQEGIADTSKVEQSFYQQGVQTKRVIHKVQLLDPAVGTATFLNETVKYLNSKFKGQEGIWESYVEKELLPRLHGFELMMAPYTIAHLKLAMTFKETGINHFGKRLGIYLTNTLEEGVSVKQDLFNIGLAGAISEEAKTASVIKHETPIMVILGNPPYSGESFNKGAYAMKLVDKYKFEPGGKLKLKERNPKWINDDYVKFIAFAEKMIAENEEGIVAMITNHGYLDNPTFRGMRWHLANTFSTIYVIDLHGNAKKKEVTPSGSPDNNVFDIQQGVSIIIAIKHKSKANKLSDIFRTDVWGRRKEKFSFLLNNNIKHINWEKVRLNNSSYIFQNRNEINENEYNKGIKVNELFSLNTVGIVTARDNMSIQNTYEGIKNVVNDFMNLDIDDLRSKYKLGSDVRDWSVNGAKLDIKENFDKELITKIDYRPFDTRFTYYTGNSRGFHCYPRSAVMQNYLNGENIGLITVRQVAEDTGFNHVLLSKNIVDSRMTLSNKGICYSFPLYQYLDNSQTKIYVNKNRIPNLNMDLVKKLLINIKNYNWISDHEDKHKFESNIISPLDILDYIYAILSSPNYRKKYKDFLKSDFPYIPIANDTKSFWQLVNFGSRLRKLHLMEDPELTQFFTNYPIGGNNMIDKIEYRGNCVYINELQFFGDVPQNVWEFQIGGYQPAQKWLKDRKGKTLTFQDISHYQKIIKALAETIKIMVEIDNVDN